MLTLIAMFLIGLISWFVATVTAGGAGLIFLVAASTVLPLPIVTMILGFAGTVAGFYRAWIYRKHVSWSILKWLIPGTLIGAAIGSLLFGSLVGKENIKALELFLAVLLILSGFLGFFKIKTLNLKAKEYLFLPMGIFTSFLSGLIGASSPIINALFQKFKMKPNQVMGTKSLNIFILQLAKTIIYMFSVLIAGKAILDDKTLSLESFVLLGSITAIGSSLGVYAGKHVLDKIDEEFFNKILNLMMFFYGIYLLAKNSIL